MYEWERTCCALHTGTVKLRCGFPARSVLVAAIFFLLSPAYIHSGLWHKWLRTTSRRSRCSTIRIIFFLYIRPRTENWLVLTPRVRSSYYIGSGVEGKIGSTSSTAYAFDGAQTQDYFLYILCIYIYAYISALRRRQRWCSSAWIEPWRLNSEGGCGEEAQQSEELEQCRCTSTREEWMPRS